MMNVIRFDYSIYLIEGACKAADMAERIIADRRRHIERWREWGEANLPEGVALRYDALSGRIGGFVFPDGPPKGWRKPDRNGCCWPKVKNPISKTLPKNKSYRDGLEYCKDYGIEIPTVITVYNADGEVIRRTGMGHWFEPVQLLYTAANADGDRLRALLLPDYKKEIAERKSELADGQNMYPDEQFDYRHFLEGCRLIPKYEWDYLVGKWQESLKTEE